MKKFINISLLILLLVSVSSRCFGMMSIAFVSKERAKELGIELRVKESGPNDVRVELEFKPVGELKQFGHVSLEIRDGDKFLMGYTPLKEKRSSSGSVVVHFMANRAFLDKVTLSIVVGEVMNYSGYELKVKDFVEPVVKTKRVFTPEEAVKEHSENEITVAFRVEKAYGISGSVPVGEEPSFGLAPSVGQDNVSRFSVLIAGQLVKDAKRFGVEPFNPGPFLKGRVIEVTGTVEKFDAPNDKPDAKPSYQMVVRSLENFRIAD